MQKKRVIKRVLAMVLAIVMVATGTLNIDIKSVDAASATPVATHGKLSVSGTQLVDQYGNAFQIRGVSTHGLQWYNQYNTKASYQTLRDDWGANCIRLAMYVEEGGYMSDKSGMKTKVNNGVSYATELGMYAIIDWHILNGNTANPKNYTSEAKAFFAEMAQKYKDNNNVIYEICNEPNNCSWSDIKSYAVEIIQTIRTYDKDAIIIVGTPTWSQLGSQGHLYEPCDDPITGYSNIMYAFHFYASDSSHNQWLTEKIGTAISRGLPVFVTEFGLSEASGDGTVDTSKATEWLNRCDKYNVSYCVWSLSNDYRSSSLIKSSSSKTSGWSTDELTTAGNFIRNWYRAKKETVNPVINNPEVKNIASNVVLAYTTHVQDYGWQSEVTTGGTGSTSSSVSGTTGSGKRLEGITIRVASGSNLGIRYKTHIQDIGWQEWKYDGELSGTTGKAKRLEAICIELTGADKDKYDVYYRVHAQNFGWLDWAKNGEAAGTEGYAYRLEAINIVVVPKGADTGLSTVKSFVTPYPGSVNYSTHVQDYGWQNFVYDGTSSGTTGQAKRLEGIKIRLNKDISGGITYSTHVQDYGWQGWASNGGVSGTTGQGKRLEAIKIKLTGDAESKYDVYYRVHVQNYGWLDWAKNGEMSGTSGLGLRLEGIQIKLVPKGGQAPGATANSYIIG
jgi:endoglucanase